MVLTIECIFLCSVFSVLLTFYILSFCPHLIVNEDVVKNEMIKMYTRISFTFKFETLHWSQCSVCSL